MKFRFVPVLIFGFLLVSFSHTEDFKQPHNKAEDIQKLSLIVSVGNYPPTGGWPKLSSGRDAEILSEALKVQGFNSTVILKDADAKKKEIVKGIEKNLIKKAKPGDIIYLHFSGHGQQIWDHENPSIVARSKDEMDGFDEALIPHDARDEFRKGVYEGENHLTDDEIQVLLNELRVKVGPSGQVIFSVDACHSGTINRDAGLLPIRGTAKKFAPEDIKQGNNGKKDNSGFVESFELADKKEMGDLIVFSASRAEQSNYETLDVNGESIGSLSLAISQNLVKLKKDQSVYSFFQQVKVDMAKLAPHQSPQLEGNAEKALFGGAIIPADGIGIQTIINDKKVKVNAGKLGGLYENTTVKLKNKTDGNEVNGEVKEVGVTSSIILLETALSSDNPADWEVKIQSEFKIIQPIKVRLNVAEGNWQNLISAKFEVTERVEISNEYAELIIHQNTANTTLVLQDLSEKTLLEIPYGSKSEEAVVQELFERIERYTRAKYIRNLESTGEATERLSLEIVPVEVKKVGNKYQVSEEIVSQNESDGNYKALDIGTNFIFKITNNTDEQFFFNILGADSEDNVFLLIPDAVSAPDEYMVMPGESLMISNPAFIFKLVEPKGKDLYTLIASPESIDLRPVFKQPKILESGNYRGASPKNDENAIGKLFFGNTRGGYLATERIWIDNTVVEIQ